MVSDVETDDESVLVGLLFEKITKLYPDWKMGDRTDLAMAMFAVFKRWAHSEDLTTEQESEQITSRIVRFD